MSAKRQVIYAVFRAVGLSVCHHGSAVQLGKGRRQPEVARLGEVNQTVPIRIRLP